jgi:diguanylate cyclase (GGDEF)-like protein
MAAIVLAIGLLLLSFIYLHSKTVIETSETLVEQDVAALRTMFQFKEAIFEHNLIINEFRTTVHKQHFLQHTNAVYQIISQKIDDLKQILPAHPELQLFSELHQQTHNLSVALDQALNTSPVNKKHIDTMLGDISAISVQMNNHTHPLIKTLKKDMENNGLLIHTKTQTSVYLVTLLSTLLIVVSIVTGYYLVKWRRFIWFPERNPNPVLSLDEKGILMYSNPGATTTATSLELTSTIDMLPPMLQEKLALARSIGQPGAYWEYKISKRIFSCRIRYQSDLNCYHVYLADITSYKQTEEKLQHLAYHDVLTGLPNRHSFENMLMLVLQKERAGAVLLLRLDRFRFIVEALGHTPADQALIAVANRLSQLMSYDDNITCHIHRFESDIFAILLPNTSQDAELQTFTQQITDLMHAPFILDGRKLNLSLSIGISIFPGDGHDSNTLLRHADMALQQVKRAGGNNIRRYLPEMDYRSLERLELLQELRDAEKRGELELYYQPQFDILSEEIIGVEALIRWNHPQRGMVSPADFIPLAEETDMITSIGEWVLTAACKQNKAWQDAGFKPLVVSVNISPRQFQSPDLQATVQHSLKISGLAPCWLALELTESAAMHDAEIAATTLGALKSLGIRLSIDDFGTGYSSLAYLKRFPIDKLKIDQSFVRNMTHENSDMSIIKTIITLGHSLGLKLIAEGVENHDQLSMLKDFGCEEVQGYLFAKPQPHTELSLLLKEKEMFAAEEMPINS